MDSNAIGVDTPVHNSDQITSRNVIPQEQSTNTEDLLHNFTRVTEVLSPFSGINLIPKHIVEHAADRGTRTHLACEGIIKGIGKWNIDSEIEPYVQSFEKWWALGHTVMAQEQRFFDHQRHITGQVDLIIKTDNGCAIVDLKTSYKPSKTWPLQGSAYAYLARQAGYNITDIQFIHLDKTGAPPTIYNYTDQWKLYLSCLDVYNHFYKKQKKNKK